MGHFLYKYVKSNIYGLDFNINININIFYQKYKLLK